MALDWLNNLGFVRGTSREMLEGGGNKMEGGGWFKRLSMAEGTFAIVLEIWNGLDKTYS